MTKDITKRWVRVAHVCTWVCASQWVAITPLTASDEETRHSEGTASPVLARAGAGSAAAVNDVGAAVAHPTTIHNVPNEVLARIFAALLGRDADNVVAMQDYCAHANRLSLVCHNWRDVFLNMPLRVAPFGKKQLADLSLRCSMTPPIWGFASLQPIVSRLSDLLPSAHHTPYLNLGVLIDPVNNEDYASHTARQELLRTFERFPHLFPFVQTVTVVSTQTVRLTPETLAEVRQTMHQAMGLPDTCTVRHLYYAEESRDGQHSLRDGDEAIFRDWQKNGGAPLDALSVRLFEHAPAPWLEAATIRAMISGAKAAFDIPVSFRCHYAGLIDLRSLRGRKSGHVKQIRSFAAPADVIADVSPQSLQGLPGSVHLAPVHAESGAGFYLSHLACEQLTMDSAPVFGVSDCPFVHVLKSRHNVALQALRRLPQLVILSLDLVTPVPALSPRDLPLLTVLCVKSCTGPLTIEGFLFLHTISLLEHHGNLRCANLPALRHLEVQHPNGALDGLQNCPNLSYINLMDGVDLTPGAVFENCGTHTAALNADRAHPPVHARDRLRPKRYGRP